MLKNFLKCNKFFPKVNEQVIIILIYSSILIFLFLAWIFADFGSMWIDSLYRQKPEILSFPASVKNRSRFRKIFLTLAWTICLIPCLNFSADKLFCGLIFSYFLLLTVCTDFEQQVIFDKILFVFGVFGFLSIALLGSPIFNHVLAAVVGGGFFLLLAILTHGGIGGGDIKLVFVLGLWCGTELLINILFLGFISSGLVALVLFLARKKKRGEFIAYGPYFALSAIYFVIFAR